MKILAVDDDEIHLGLLEAVLAGNPQHDVVLARSASDALRLVHLAKAPFDCFLLDIDMPGMNGIDLCAEIRKLPDHAGVPILMLTRMSDQEHVEAAFSAGATDYVTKPINEFELATRLKLAGELLAQKRRIDAMGVEIRIAKCGLGGLAKVDLTTAFPLQDVVGAIDFVAFENFLLRSSMESRNLDLLAVKIANVEEMFRGLDEPDFSFAVHSVADEIAEVLKRRRFFLTYAGNGVFPIALRNGAAFDLESFAFELFDLTSDIELKLSNDSRAKLELCIGKPVKAPFFARRANLNSLSEAIANAEEAASQIRAKTGVSLGKGTEQPGPYRRLISGW